MFSDNALKRLIIPLVIEQTLVMLVGMADTLMVSYAGEAAISGVALVDMFEYMIITILTSVSAGGAVIISQYLGGGDEENAGLSASQLMTISILISAVISAVCLAFHRPILNLFYSGAEAEVMSAADSYLAITAGSFFFSRNIQFSGGGLPFNGQNQRYDVRLAYDEHYQYFRECNRHFCA